MHEIFSKFKTQIEPLLCIDIAPDDLRAVATYRYAIFNSPFMKFDWDVCRHFRSFLKCDFSVREFPYRFYWMQEGHVFKYYQKYAIPWPRQPRRYMNGHLSIEDRLSTGCRISHCCISRYSLPVLLDLQRRQIAGEKNIEFPDPDAPTGVTNPNS